MNSQQKIYTSFDHLPSTVTRIKLNHSRIRQLTRDSLRRFKRVTELKLAYNQLESIDVDSFVPVPQLERLHLFGNCLDGIQDGTFRALVNLDLLYLSYNRLTEITVNTFANLKSLKTLFVNRNEISVISAEMFCDLEMLEFLKLSDNELSELPNDLFRYMTCLKTLHLDDNRIKSIDDDAFKGLAKLEELFLHENQLGVDPDRSGQPLMKPNLFQGLERLCRLNLKSNSIATVHDQVFDVVSGSLMELYLQHNRLTMVNDRVFSRLETLQVLNLSGNEITFIHENAFDHLASLRELNLSANKLESLGFLKPKASGLRGLLELDELNLGCNLIKRIEATHFNHFTRLQKLYLYQNEITEIEDESFSDLKDLERLYLFKNSLTKISVRTFVGLGELEKLYLSDNQIETIEVGSFSHLTKLKDLFLFKNKITEIADGSFDGLLKLENLFLFCNRLESWPDTAQTFRHFKHLKHIYLSNNRLKSIREGCFSGINSLKVLDLSFNMLKNIELGSFSGLPELDILNLSTNELSELDGDLVESFEATKVLLLDHNRLKTFDFSRLNSSQRIQDIYLNCNPIEHPIDHSEIERLLRLSQFRLLFIDNQRFDYGQLGLNAELQTKIVVDQELNLSEKSNLKVDMLSRLYESENPEYLPPNGQQWKLEFASELFGQFIDLIQFVPKQLNFSQVFSSLKMLDVILGDDICRARIINRFKELVVNPKYMLAKFPETDFSISNPGDDLNLPNDYRREKKNYLNMFLNNDNICRYRRSLTNDAFSNSSLNQTINQFDNGHSNAIILKDIEAARMNELADKFQVENQSLYVQKTNLQEIEIIRERGRRIFNQELSAIRNDQQVIKFLKRQLIKKVVFANLFHLLRQDCVYDTELVAINQFLEARQFQYRIEVRKSPAGSAIIENEDDVFVIERGSGERRSLRESDTYTKLVLHILLIVRDHELIKIHEKTDLKRIVLFDKQVGELDVTNLIVYIRDYFVGAMNMQCVFTSNRRGFLRTETLSRWIIGEKPDWKIFELEPCDRENDTLEENMNSLVV